MTQGWATRPAEDRANSFERCILELIRYHDRREVWEAATQRPMTNADIAELILDVSRPRVFKCAGHICRYEDKDGKVVLYYDAKPLGGDWLIERVREIVGIPDGQMELY
jgi:hypothetical protein